MFLCRRAVCYAVVFRPALVRGSRLSRLFPVQVVRAHKAHAEDAGGFACAYRGGSAFEPFDSVGVVGVCQAQFVSTPVHALFSSAIISPTIFSVSIPISSRAFFMA